MNYDNDDDIISYIKTTLDILNVDYSALDRTGKLMYNDDEFDNTIKVIQKHIYLLQNLGISYGIGYYWFVRGPYSPQLRSYINKLLYVDAKQLNLKVIERLETYKNDMLFFNININNGVFLEYLSDIIYIYNQQISYYISKFGIIAKKSYPLYTYKDDVNKIWLIFTDEQKKFIKNDIYKKILHAKGWLKREEDATYKDEYNQYFDIVEYIGLLK